MRYSKFTIHAAGQFAVAVILLCALGHGRAQPRLHCETISANGSLFSSSAFHLLTVAGQAFPIEPAANAGFVLHPGFVSCLANEVVTSVNDDRGKIPEIFALMQNQPNPFNPETRIFYDLPKAAKVDLAIFNILGQRVKTLVNRTVHAGHHEAWWDGTDESGRTAAAGIYLFRLDAEGRVFQRSMTLLR